MDRPPALFKVREHGAITGRGLDATSPPHHAPRR